MTESIFSLQRNKSIVTLSRCAFFLFFLFFLLVFFSLSGIIVASVTFSSFLLQSVNSQAIDRLIYTLVLERKWDLRDRSRKFASVSDFEK